MTKKLVTLLSALVCGFCALASVTISVSTKTVQKTGGGGTITVSGTDAWTAVSDSTWITVKSGASGDGDGKVMFTVSENTTADTRIGHINITGDNVYTITQYGYTGSISTSSTTCDLGGETGTITVTVDAGVTWSATPNVDWITVTPTSGRSVGSVTYTVLPYNGVVTRNGSITIAGCTFAVTQTGVDVNIEPKVAKVESDADIVQIAITALAGTKWAVTPNASWISVLDKEQGYGDYVLTLAVNANPSFARRTGTVAVGTATLTIVQNGKETACLAIDPENAAASASGAYGNVAVYATPDAPWTAESLTSWVTISQGQEGAGNGNIKYVASANPTLQPREGIIKITPPYKEPDVDLLAGLACRIPSFTSDEGNGDRYFLWCDAAESATTVQNDLQKAADTWLPLTASSSSCSANTATTWDGVSAVQFAASGLTMSSKVAGPGTLTHWWKGYGVYQSRYYNNLSVDGSLWDSSQSTSWAKVAISVTGKGNHSLKWSPTFNNSAYSSQAKCWIDRIVWKSTATSIPFDGTSPAVLNGHPFVAKPEDDYSVCVSFSVNELDRVNRLFTFADESIYLDTDNRLIFNEIETDFTVETAGVYYTVLIRQTDDGVLSVYAGSQGTTLRCVLETEYPQLLDFSSDVTTDFVKLGATTLPTPGNLTSGEMKNFRFWTRALSDDEAEQVDTAATIFDDDAPKYAPTGAVWNYFPLDQNGLSTASSSAAPTLKENTIDNVPKLGMG